MMTIERTRNGQREHETPLPSESWRLVLFELGKAKIWQMCDISKLPLAIQLLSIGYCIDICAN